MFVAAIVPPQRSPRYAPTGQPVDNSVMLIKVAGQEYLVTNSLKCRSLSLSSIADEINVEIERTKIYKNINNNDATAVNKMTIAPVNQMTAAANKTAVAAKKAANRDEVRSKVGNVRRGSRDSIRHKNETPALAKSKSEGNPFRHKKQGKIIRVSQRGLSV